MWVTKFSFPIRPTTSSSARRTKHSIPSPPTIRVAHAKSHRCWCASRARPLQTVIHADASKRVEVIRGTQESRHLQQVWEGNRLWRDLRVRVLQDSRQGRVSVLP